MEHSLSPHPTPDVRRARLLAEANKNKIFASLGILLDACSEIMPVGYKNFIYRKLDSYREYDDCNPLLFKISEKLFSAIEAEDVDAARIQLQTLASLPVSDKVQGRPSYLIFDKKFLSTSLLQICDEIGDDTFTVSPKSIDSKEVEESINTIERCFDALEKANPELYQEILEITQRIGIFATDSFSGGLTMHSGSKLDYLGCIFINANTCGQKWHFWADKIVHEAAHQVLLSIMLHDAVILNPDTERYRSPLRTEGRTLTGIYHAAFVIYRIIVAFESLIHQNEIDADDVADIKSSMLDYIAKFKDAYSVILDHGRMTSFGSTLIKQCNLAVVEVEERYVTTAPV